MSNGISYCVSWAVGLPNPDGSRGETTEEQASSERGQWASYSGVETVQSFKKFQSFNGLETSLNVLNLERMHSV